MKRVRARVATTHRLPAYGGIRLTEQALRQMVKQMADGLPRMNLQHDMARPIRPANVEAGVETLDDGELAAWIEFDIDEHQWQGVEREWQAAGAPGGFSYSMVDRFATHGRAPYDIAIIGDAAHFDRDALLMAARQCLSPRLSVELGHLYQFSWMPEPKVVIEVALALLTTAPADLIETYLVQLAQWLASRLAQNRPEAVPTFELRVHRTPRSHTTELKIKAKDGDQLAQAMREVPAILRAEGQAFAWNATANEWNQISG